MPPLPRLANLSIPARALAAQALAANTRRVYVAQWRAWIAFAKQHNRCSLPAAPGDVADWLAMRAAGHAASSRDTQPLGASLATLRSAVAAVRMAHIASNAAFDTTAPEIQLILRGAARTRLRAPRQAKPARAGELAHLVRARPRTARGARDAALLAVGYSFALRRSDLVGLDFAQAGDGRGVLIIQRDRLEVHLLQSKTRPFDGCQAFVVPRRGNTLLLTLLKRWIVNGNILPGTPLFRRVRKGDAVTSQRLDGQSVVTVLRDAVVRDLRRGGVDEHQARELACGYSGHSLRVGFAVTAAEAGADIGVIQRALGHATATMASRYSHAAETMRTSPFRLSGVALASPPKAQRSSRTPR